MEFAAAAATELRKTKLLAADCGGCGVSEY